MKIRTVTLCLLACLFSFPLFALHPSSSAPLWDHLMEVNVQWDRQVRDRDAFRQIVRFDDDTERIRTHLSLVESILRDRPTGHLNSQQRTNRLAMLDHLKDYHQAGKFPRNHDFRLRTPVFIDDYGTACAVGYLLIRDGQEEFAQRIRKEMNNAYLLDMPYKEIPAWAELNGFTPEELAWIQPGYPYTATSCYPPATTFPNDEVHFLFTDDANSQLIIAGDFTTINGVNANHIATWDGSTFSPIGQGIDGTVKAAIVFNGDLYLGGSFNQGAHNLAIFNGSTWAFQAIFDGVINAFAQDNGILFAGGDLTHNGAVLVQHIVRLEQGVWSSVGQGFDEPVHALAIHNGSLYAGGEFHASGIDSMNYVAVWTGTDWQQVLDGLDAPVKSLASDGNDLYAGGWIYNPQNSQNRSFGLVRTGQGQWERLMADTIPFDFHNGTGSEITRIHFNQGHTYVSGSFNVGDMMYYGRDVAVYVGGYFGLAPMAAPDQRILSTAIFNDELVMGGDFKYINPFQIDYLAAVSVLLGRPAPVDVRLTAYPVPAANAVRISLPPNTQQPRVILSDLAGRNWPVEVDRGTNELILRRGPLAAGTYLVRLSDGTVPIGTGKVVFE